MSDQINGDWQTVFNGTAGKRHVIVEKKITNVSPGDARMRATVMDQKMAERGENEVTFAGPPDEFETSKPEDLVEWLKRFGMTDREARDAVRHALDPQEQFGQNSGAVGSNMAE